MSLKRNYNSRLCPNQLADKALREKLLQANTVEHQQRRHA